MKIKAVYYRRYENGYLTVVDQQGRVWTKGWLNKEIPWHEYRSDVWYEVNDLPEEPTTNQEEV